MTIRFDLPESLEEVDEQEEGLDQPCFPYPGYEDRHGGIGFWSSVTERPAVRLNLGEGGRYGSGLSLTRSFRTRGRKVLLRVGG